MLIFMFHISSTCADQVAVTELVLGLFPLPTLHIRLDKQVHPARVSWCIYGVIARMFVLSLGILLSENTFAGHWATVVDCMENISNELFVQGIASEHSQTYIKQV